MKVGASIRSFGKANAGPLRRLTEHGFEVTLNPHGRVLTREEVVELLRDKVALLAGTEPLDEWVFARLPGLRVISRVGAGLDNVDLEAARRRRIQVFNTPEAASRAVAELALGLMLALLRSIPAADAGVRCGQWSAPLGHLLGGKTVGIVGVGRVGSSVARLLQPFGAQLLGNDNSPTAAERVGALGVHVMALDELLAQSDIVTLHVALDAASHRLIDARRIAAMKGGAYLINLARGGVVDEVALHEALRSGKLAGAALDVFAREPYRGPLCELPNVILSPHMGSSTMETRSRMEAEAAENVISALGTAGMEDRS